jgi:transcriptional regulator with XRE-family HTH domain
MTMNQSISGEEFRRLRLEKGLSQNELSNIAGLGGQSVVSNVERGLPPGPAVERRLREALGLIAPDGAREPGKVTVSA